MQTLPEIGGEGHCFRSARSLLFGHHLCQGDKYVLGHARLKGVLSLPRLEVFPIIKTRNGYPRFWE